MVSNADFQICKVDALEILDSRGNPTVRVLLELEGGRTAVASVPSGASTGRFEALELRDGAEVSEDSLPERPRYGGKGVRRAVASVRDIIAPALIGQDVRRQAALDRLMLDLDGTENKARLGANAILGVSMAIARAAASAAGLPLYASLGGSGARRLPVPMMNVLNGGLHAANALDFQEFMIVPHGAPTFAEALRYGSETFHALRALLYARGYVTSVGDEGGFAPDLPDNETACSLIVDAIEKAGYRPGTDIAIALDPASSSFGQDGSYRLQSHGMAVTRSSHEMNELYADWIARYPIVSLEDGLAEDDWAGFAKQTSLLGGSLQIVGDDIFVTNPAFIERGIREKTANAVLIKLNQIGTVTETVAAIEAARRAGWAYVISHRSGETEDSFLADFAVAMGGGQIKTGSLCRSERIAKYNRLLEIEHELGAEAEFVSPFAVPRI
ncbi:phosphopyruvate hydratase [Gluconobacter oxydans]|nr:Enolase [Gluconobacter oxydans H24]ANQ40040.1 phosphopyruvate hydratase [Gluconobacter oxydans]